MKYNSIKRAKSLDVEYLKAEAYRRAKKENINLNAFYSSRRFLTIAEIKKASPSESAFESEIDILIRAREYQAAGVDIISVLTEPEYFVGSIDDIEKISSSINTPIMRKDFLVDLAQIYEAKAAGASGVLLIAKILDKKSLELLLIEAQKLNMFVLLEAFDEYDLSLMNSIKHPFLAGVNCRNLENMRIELSRFRTLRGLMPSNRRIIAESGVSNVLDLCELVSLNYSGALIGSMLMRCKTVPLLQAKLNEIKGIVK